MWFLLLLLLIPIVIALIKLGFKALKYLDYVVITILAMWVLMRFDLFFTGRIHAVFVILLTLAPAFLYAVLSNVIRIGNVYPLKILSVLFCGFGIWWMCSNMFNLDTIWSITIGIAAALIIGSTRLVDNEHYDDQSDYESEYAAYRQGEQSSTRYTPPPPQINNNTNRLPELMKDYKRVNDRAKDYEYRIEDMRSADRISDEDYQFICECLIDFENRDKTVIQNEFDKLSSAGSDIEIRATIKFVEQMIEKQESICDEISAEFDRIFRESKGTERHRQEGVASFSIFAGCDTAEKLKKRYKELSKNYHPDTDSGDKEAMQAINSEYERLLEEFEV